MNEFSLHELESVLKSRQSERPEGSYSLSLLDDPERAARKIVEEAFEVSVEIMRPSVDEHRVASEAADLVFHLLAGLVGAGVTVDDVLAELERRRS
ncbi:MAG TPA: phosphoribosyl-ATP diphosphatase [Mycobacteriales bacterium]|nr:phosphoribosyl-ATP diphosphatase [Mycobacteriales bacterium]